ncbi:MAG TPA: hypothetical protein VMS18_04110 [Candidatus Binatia bacterium]|nr:hypothetical protein [Candidatus Binatia bacterium]
MRSDEFQRCAKRWLSTYRRDVLGVEDDGIWVQNGKAYPHILPQAKHQLNILPSFRDQFWRWFPGQHIQLQRDFHHLNSSQALCFNLFFPMLNGRQALGALLPALNIEGIAGNRGDFEYQPELSEGTCIDFSLPLQSGGRVNFEIKYTESEFGSAKADEAHIDKFDRVYRHRLAGRFSGPFCRPEKFLEHYQIARNIWHLNETAGDIAVFLFPKANTCLRRQEPVIKVCALEPFRSRIRIMYLEDLVLDLFNQLSTSDTGRFLAQFRLKYLSFLTPGASDTSVKDRTL